jgi:hypothetical protein
VERRDDDLIEVLPIERLGDAPRLTLTALCQRWVDDVQTVANPLRLAVADEY